MTSIYTRAGSCSCFSPGIEKALARGAFEKAAARRPGKRPHLTRVAKYVAKHSPKLGRQLAAVFKKHRQAVALRISARYADSLGVQKVDMETISLLLELNNSNSLSEAAVTILRSKLLQAFKEGAGAGLETLADLKNVDIGEVLTPGITDQVDPEAVFYASNRGGQLIKDLAGTTDDDMRELLSTAIDDGVTPEDLADQIQDLGAFSDARAMTIARTELAFAYVQGNVEGWKASGEVEQKRWILGDLHDIADECDDCVDAGVVGMDDDFVDGIDYPPAHPNCVCDVLPVLSVVDQPDDSTDNADDSTDGEDS